MPMITKFIQIILSPKVWISKLLLFLFVIAFLAFGFLDELDPLEAYLDKWSGRFKLGEIEFSLYGMIRTIGTVIIFFWAAGVIADLIESWAKKRKEWRSSNALLVTKLSQIILYFLALTFTLNVLGIDLTTLAIFGGAVGIGIGFGLQKITSNFISGIILLFERTVENNDLVELNDGTYGFIKNMAARYTLVETFDGKEIMIPNEDFITCSVINWTYSNSLGRVDIEVGVSYDSDIELVMKIMLDAAITYSQCIAIPKPECFLREFGPSSIDFLLFFWVEDVKDGRYKAKSDVMCVIWKKFQKHNIVIPFPQHDLHIKTDKKLEI